MAIVVQFSEAFNERFGRDAVGEFVDLVNQIAMTFRAELRELNEANFARFEGLLHRQLGDQGTELRQEIAAVRIELKAEIAAVRIELKAEIAALRTEMKTEIAAVRSELKDEIATLRTEVKTEIADLRAELKAEIAELRADLRVELAASRAEAHTDVLDLKAAISQQFVAHTRWMVGMWIPVVLALIAIVLKR